MNLVIEFVLILTNFIHTQITVYVFLRWPTFGTIQEIFNMVL